MTHWLFPLVASLCIALHHGAARGQMQVGINLASPTDWGRVDVFKDAMRQSRWLAKNEWHLLFWGHNTYPAGRYVCEWDGDDAPKFVRGVGSAAIDEVLPGLAVLDVPVPVSGIAIQPFGDVKNLKLWLPGVNRGGSVFNPGYVESLRPFKVLRFMDWQRTNLSTIESWSDLRLPDESSQWEGADTRGVAPKLCLDLAREVGASPWLCIPHLADDDYVVELAKLAANNLADGAVVYLEPGNEICWNTASGFNGGRWLTEFAKTTGIRSVDYYGAWVKRINGLARPILGARLRLVVAGQANNPWIAEQEAKAAGRGNFDAVSCAWYFGLPKGFVGDETTTVGDVIDACETDINGRLVERLAAHARLAATYGVPLVLYEGGQHLVVPATSPIADEVLAAQRHPRMGDLYRLALAKCRDAGASLAVAYQDVSPWGPGGSWGAREYMTDYAAPKWAALVEAQ